MLSCEYSIANYARLSLLIYFQINFRRVQLNVTGIKYTGHLVHSILYTTKFNGVNFAKFCGFDSTCMKSFSLLSSETMTLSKCKQKLLKHKAIWTVRSIVQRQNFISNSSCQCQSQPYAELDYQGGKFTSEQSGDQTVRGWTWSDFTTIHEVCWASRKLCVHMECQVSQAWLNLQK